MAVFAPAHVKAILTSFARFHISSANTNVELHAYGFLVFAELDLAVLGDLNLALVFALAFSFCRLILGVLVDSLGIAWT